jgi:argininosuccinate synthase
MNDIILAFSGGLDTSFCILYLQEQGYRVTTVTVDTGGFTSADLTAIEQRSKELGAVQHYTIDGRQELWDKTVTYIIKGNILRGGVYPLCVGPERIIQASKMVEIAKQIGADAIAHGSTGAGNDQVRFDVAIRVLSPNMKIITPIRELGLTRKQETAYLTERGFNVPAKTQDYSFNQGLIGTTIGGKETLTSWESPPDHIYPSIVPIEQAPSEGIDIILGFENGLPSGIDGEAAPELELISKLSQIGAENGVGKNIHLGNTILGIKGRVAFEAPAMTILITAHRELEKLILTDAQAFWKNHLATVYGDMLHRGNYFDPVMRDIEAMIDSSQTCVTGQVKVKLQRGNIIVKGLQSPYSLMAAKVGVYGEESRFWSGEDAQGFCKIYGLQSMLAYQTHQADTKE